MIKMIPIMGCNSTTGKVKALIVAKNGMARKAMIKNIQTGNTTNLQKQIDKGTVKILQ